MIGATLGNSLTLECETEAYPKPIHYWTLDNGQLLTEGIKFLQKVQKLASRILIRYTPLYIHNCSGETSDEVLEDFEETTNILEFLKILK